MTTFSSGDIVLAEGTVVTSSRRYAHKLRALLEF